MFIKVTVHPESTQDSIAQRGPDVYDVYVRASAQHGHANKVVTALLSKHFGSGVRMVSGGTRSHKIFAIL